MKNKIYTSMTLAALAFAFSPTIALAGPNHSSMAHQRPSLFHERGTQLHTHSSVAHH